MLKFRKGFALLIISKANNNVLTNSDPYNLNTVRCSENCEFLIANCELLKMHLCIKISNLYERIR